MPSKKHSAAIKALDEANIAGTIQHLLQNTNLSKHGLVLHSIQFAPRDVKELRSCSQWSTKSVTERLPDGRTVIRTVPCCSLWDDGSSDC